MGYDNKDRTIIECRAIFGVAKDINKQDGRFTQGAGETLIRF